MEQVNCFKYLESLISCEKDVDIDNKLNDYLKITAIINNTENLKQNKNTTTQFTGSSSSVISQ